MGVQVASPLPFGIPMITVTGRGDTFIVEGSGKYPDEGELILVLITDGRVLEEVWYWASPFELPDWRRPFRKP